MTVPEEAWLIRTEGLTRTYQMGTHQVRALRGIDMEVKHGEFVALMGASGSGKSTLMHLLGCLDSPTAGQYWLEGKEVSTLSGEERAKVRRCRIGFIFQTFNLLARLTAVENVELPMLYRRGIEQARQRAEEMLIEVGLGHRLDHRPAEMSGGECQRVAIARAVVSQPAIVLADEPTGNLDSVTGQGIMDLLHRLHLAGQTVLMVTHSAETAAHAGRVLHMADGRIVKSTGPLSAPSGSMVWEPLTAKEGYAHVIP